MGTFTSGTDDEQPRHLPLPIPPEGGFTVDDLYRFPQLPRHTELFDGTLVFARPRRLFHTETVDLLRRQLTRQAPTDLYVAREMTMVLDLQNAPEPDVLVVRREALTGLDQTRFTPEDVVLAIEVVSPESLTRDRETKPMKYAKAGIRHFWRVERDADRAVVYVFEREPATGAYVPEGIFHHRLKLTTPFPTDVDLTGVVP